MPDLSLAKLDHHGATGEYQDTDTSIGVRLEKFNGRTKVDDQGLPWKRV